VTEDKKLAFPRFQQYLRDGFVPHPIDISANVWIRAFAKWYFDFVKNAITVGALMAIAKRTHSAPIYALAVLSFIVLGTYVVAHIQSWHFEPFHGFHNSRLASAAGLILWVIVATALIAGVQYILITAIDAIVDSNTK
jgi:hypothetical protein